MNKLNRKVKSIYHKKNPAKPLFTLYRLSLCYHIKSENILLMIKEPLNVPTPCCTKTFSKVKSSQISQARNQQDKLA